MTRFLLSASPFEASAKDDDRDEGGVKAPVVSLRAALKTTAAVVFLSGFGVTSIALATPAVKAGIASAMASKAQIDIRVGRNDSAGRIEIYGSTGSRASVRRDNGQVVVRLPGNLRPDIGDLSANPPEGVRSVSLRQDSRATELLITLKDGVESHFGRADGAVFVQIDLPKSQVLPTRGEASITLQELERKVGVAPTAAETVQVQATAIDGGVDLSFPFTAPVGASVFRRGESVWIVFDKDAELKLPATLRDGKLITAAAFARNDGFTALRLTAPAGAVTASVENGTWRVRVGGRSINTEQVSEVSVARDDTTGASALAVNMAGAGRVAWIRDPAIGDRMAVITARGPVKRLMSERTTPQAALGTTAQGLVVERMSPDITVDVSGDIVTVSRPKGLSLSAPAQWARAEDETIKTLEYKAAAFPSLMDEENWSKLPTGGPMSGFLSRYNQLQQQAADEADKGIGATTGARLSLARFLIGQGLNFEAIGMLDLLGKQTPAVLGDPQFRGLRVMAKIMAGRYRDARVDLDSTALISDPAADLWRGYVAVQEGHFAEARQSFKDGAGALDVFPATWRTRFAAANAYAAYQTNDLTAAKDIITYAVSQNAPPLETLEAQLVQAQIFEGLGDKNRALKMYDAIARAPVGRIAMPAQMRAARLNLALGRSKSDDTLDKLNGLRYRWRGDDAELELLSTIGDIYLGQGRYRQALETLKSSGQQFAGRPDALPIQAKLNTAFRGLFLDGQADGLQPVEALGLFYDFRDLTPIGADGDEMVRRLARRLMDVDLLDQAADLLQYQIDNRLQGVAKASVASDVAAIQLMNRQPEKALQALWKTRTSLLPKPVMAERRILEARALTELGRTEHALEVLGPDNSGDAMDIRADIAWRDKDWAKAGAILEKRLGDRWKRDGALSLDDESRLIRAGVAYSLMSDQRSLSRLADRFGKFAEGAQSPEAVHVALAGMDNGPINAQDFALAASKADSFTGWVAGMKKRLRDKTAQPLPGAGSQRTAANQAPAAPKA
jgi:tetratricopeptide (TPR) repeat protein